MAVRLAVNHWSVANIIDYRERTQNRKRPQNTVHWLLPIFKLALTSFVVCDELYYGGLLIVLWLISWKKSVLTCVLISFVATGNYLLKVKMFVHYCDNSPINLNLQWRFISVITTWNIALCPCLKWVFPCIFLKDSCWVLPFVMLTVCTLKIGWIGIRCALAFSPTVYVYGQKTSKFKGHFLYLLTINRIASS